MKTLKTETIKPIYLDRFLPKKEEMRKGKIYISKEFSISNHLCLCGCGEETVLPFGEGSWYLIGQDNTITITPSIQQTFKCKSHYIITDGKANFV